MPAVDYDRFFEYRFPAIKSDYIYDKMCIRVIQYFSFSLREIERYVQMMRIAHIILHIHKKNLSIGAVMPFYLR